MKKKFSKYFHYFLNFHEKDIFSTFKKTVFSKNIFEWMQNFFWPNVDTSQFFRECTSLPLDRFKRLTKHLGSIKDFFLYFFGRKVNFQRLKGIQVICIDVWKRKVFYIYFFQEFSTLTWAKNFLTKYRQLYAFRGSTLRTQLNVPQKIWGQQKVFVIFFWQETEVSKDPKWFQRMTTFSDIEWNYFEPFESSFSAKQI